MIKLKNLITEVQWENSVQSHIYAGNIPMTPKVIHRIFGVKKIVALHVSDIDNFERLAKLQGTKKSVSMTNSFRPSFIGRGVWAGAGIAAVVEGDMMIGLNADLMSAPDKQGRRWINFFHFSGAISQNKIKATKGFIHNMKLQIYLDILKKYKINDQHGKPSPKKHAIYEFDDLLKYGDAYKDDGGELTDKEIKKMKSEMIKKYMDTTERLLYVNKNWIEMLRDAASLNSSPLDGYNEVLVSNFKIKNVHIWTGAYNEENAIYYKDKVISKIIPAKNVHISDDRTSIWKAITADIEKGSK